MFTKGDKVARTTPYIPEPTYISKLVIHILI